MSLRDFFIKHPPLDDIERNLFRAAYVKGLEDAAKLARREAKNHRALYARSSSTTVSLMHQEAAEECMQIASKLRAMQTTAGAAGGEGK